MLMTAQNSFTPIAAEKYYENLFTDAFIFANSLHQKAKHKMKYLLITVGLLFVGLAILGIILPGLPTTPFLLLASAAFIRSSPKLYKWLIEHSVFGPILRDFSEKGGISLKVKIISILLVWVTIGISLVFIIDSETYRWVIAACGLLGTVIILFIKTVR